MVNGGGAKDMDILFINKYYAEIGAVQKGGHLIEYF